MEILCMEDLFLGFPLDKWGHENTLPATNGAKISYVPPNPATSPCPNSPKPLTNCSIILPVRIETLKGVSQFILPLYSHKRESDRRGEHQGWTNTEDLVLTTLAILADVGINLGTAILAITGNSKEAVLLKSIYNIGVDPLSQATSTLKNKITNRF